MKQILLIGLSIVALGGTQGAYGQQEDDLAKIEQAVGSYVEAYNSRDAKALVAHWLPEGVYVSRLTGDQITGHDALEAEFLSLFQESEADRLEVDTESIQFISPNVAVEHGSATIITPEAEPSQSNYSVVYVKRDGRWLIDRISEEPDTEVESHYDELQALEWMIGNWQDTSDEFTVSLECDWTKNKNYICRAYKVSHGEEINSSGVQIIGWDAHKKQIRSWLFDSDSGFVEGVWLQKGDRWIVQSTATLSDGSRGSSTSILRPLDDSSYGWQKINRVVDGELLPNLEEVIITRQ